MADLSEATVGFAPSRLTVSGKRFEGLAERGLTVTRIVPGH